MPRDGEAQNQEIPIGHEPIKDYTPMFHWSPSRNRESILSDGLKISQQSVEGIWRPPFIAFSTTPMLAWSLSAMRTDYENNTQVWDLWCAWDRSLKHVEYIPFDDGEPRELRVYRNVPASKLWYVGRRAITDGS